MYFSSSTNIYYILFDRYALQWMVHMASYIVIGWLQGGPEGGIEVLLASEGQKVDPEKRITTPYLTKYERARVLGTRALQIAWVFATCGVVLPWYFTYMQMNQFVIEYVFVVTGTYKFTAFNILG